MVYGVLLQVRPMSDEEDDEDGSERVRGSSDTESDPQPERIRSSLRVGFRCKWSEIVDQVRRYQQSQSTGAGHINKNKAQSGGHTSVWTCRYCPYTIRFSKREGTYAVCTFMSEGHEENCAILAASDSTRKQDWGTNRVVRCSLYLRLISTLTVCFSSINLFCLLSPAW